MTQGPSNEMSCVATGSIVELDFWIVKGVRSFETQDNMYDCPLLNRPLWMGDCYDINAVVEQWVNRSLLKSLESELDFSVHLRVRHLLAVHRSPPAYG